MVCHSMTQERLHDDISLDNFRYQFKWLFANITIQWRSLGGWRRRPGDVSPFQVMQYCNWASCAVCKHNGRKRRNGQQRKSSDCRMRVHARDSSMDYYKYTASAVRLGSGQGHGDYQAAAQVAVTMRGMSYRGCGRWSGCWNLCGSCHSRIWLSGSFWRSWWLTERDRSKSKSNWDLLSSLFTGPVTW